MRGSISAVRRSPWIRLMSFPRAREYFHTPLIRLIHTRVFPACAGVFPRDRYGAESKEGLSRVRGSISQFVMCLFKVSLSFPRAREYFPGIPHEQANGLVFPACAGVFPHHRPTARRHQCLSRVRGSISLIPCKHGAGLQSFPRAREYFRG